MLISKKVRSSGSKFTFDTTSYHIRKMFLACACSYDCNMYIFMLLKLWQQRDTVTTYACTGREGGLKIFSAVLEGPPKLFTQI